MLKLRVLILAALLMLPVLPARADEMSDLRNELSALRERLAEMESKLAASTEAPAPVSESAAKPAANQEKGVAETLDERFGTLRIHGSVLGYYQGVSEAVIADETNQGEGNAGLAADLELGWEPIENGEAVVRIHYGEGDGADRQIEANGTLLADLNTINDDNADDSLRLLEAYYAHGFLDSELKLTAGKTEPLAFIDDNAYSNDEATQFVGKPFVNDPVLDSEDEYAPMLAVTYAPAELFSFTALVQSSTRPYLDEDDQKGAFENVFDAPMLAAQAALSPGFLDRDGTYRLYAWTQTYDHPELDGDGEDSGWGLGLSLDQEIAEGIGLFGRLGYHNDAVYLAPWTWSLGASFTGLIPDRDEDTLGLGVAGLLTNDDALEGGTETHLEAYYRIALSEHLALTPDLQYVISPLGDDDNDGVFAGMLRAEFSF